MRRRTWLLAGAAVMLAVTAAGGAAGMSSAQQGTRAEQEPAANTAKLEKGKLTAMLSLNGTLTYRARPDGSPYSVINRAPGTYTRLPDEGDKVGCGDVFYRVDDKPVLLLCGAVPAYRDLRRGDVGNDVRQLNRNLHALGYAAAGVGIDPDDDDFTPSTERALEALQRDKGFVVTGTLGIGDAVFLPEPVRIAEVTGELGQGSTSADVATARAAVDAADRQLAAAQRTLAAAQATEAKEGAAAQQGVANAQQALDDARANLAAVQAQVDAGTAGARVAVANAGQALADAQRGLAAAHAQREATSGADQTGIANAEKALDAARAVVATQPAIQKEQLDKAKADLWAQQISRDATCGRGADSAACQSANATVAAAETNVNTVAAQAAQAQKQAEQTLQNAENALEAAKAAAGSDGAKLDGGVEQARTQVNQAQAGLEAAEAALQNDRAKLQGSLTAAQTQANAAESALKNAEAALATTQAKGEQAVVAARSQVDAAVSAKQTAEASRSARPGAQLLYATSDTLEVRVDLDPSQQSEVKEGGPAQVTLPGNKAVAGRVDRLGRVAQVPAGQNASDRQQVGAATIPAFIRLEDPVTASGLDRAPVRVDITTEVVENALSVPVTALVGKAGGGFAVEVVRPDGRRELVAVKLGLFDTAGGRVAVEGELVEGDLVVVPSP